MYISFNLKIISKCFHRKFYFYKQASQYVFEMKMLSRQTDVHPNKIYWI